MDSPMTRIPDFSTLALSPDQSAAPPSFPAEPWLTPEGIEVKSVYGPEDVEGLPAIDS
jgi:methylmalonyl-CoA mutase